MIGSKIQFFAEPHLSTAVWLAQLRWVAAIGQLLVIGFVWLVLQIDLPIIPLLMLVAGTMVSNALLWLWTRRRIQLLTSLNSDSEIVLKKALSEDTISSGGLGLLLIVDALTLTALLYFSGGAANPFIVFYFANIAIAGMILSRGWAVSISGTSIFGTLLLLNFAASIDVFASSPLEYSQPWGVSKTAFFIAFSTCCAVITYFVSMLAVELRKRDEQLVVAEKQKERAQRLEALATLAAGAGHELASPLSTIAVVAGELSRNLEKHDVPASVKRDVSLIREELHRCREILSRMKSGAGEAAAERLNPVRIQEIIDETVGAMREPQRVLITMSSAVANRTAMLPKQAISQALRNLLQNGLDASKPDQTIQMIAEVVGGDVADAKAAGATSGKSSVLRLNIIDTGSGMSEEVRRRIGEPFFTTKEVGQGMGLGVFLTRNVIQGLGGDLVFEVASTGGTHCCVTIPLQSQSWTPVVLNQSNLPIETRD